MTGHSHSIEDRLSELLVRWEELHQQGQSVTPEQLCQDSPELLPELKRRIQKLGLINAALKTTTVGEGRTPTPFPPVGSDPGTSVESITITSRYLQARLVDRGGMGELLIAEDVSLHREVAVKLIQHRHLGREENISRFLQEAEITSRLDHPGIAPVHTLGQSSDGRPCYTMRFIHGETMAQAIRRFHQAEANPRREPSERSLALRQLLSQFIAVCKTVAYAHSRGIIHRDLKPDNIRLGKFGETVVLDWGLAKPFERTENERATGEGTLQPNLDGDDSATRTGLWKGTPAYMSPEQAAGDWANVGPASDIYSLGATLYVLLTGRRPIEGRSGPEMQQMIQRGDYPRPRHVKQNVPAALEAICLTAMALKPAERYATVIELANEVEKWLADEPVKAYREPWTVKLQSWLMKPHKVNGLTRAFHFSIGAAVLLILYFSFNVVVLANMAPWKPLVIVPLDQRLKLDRAQDNLRRSAQILADWSSHLDYKSMEHDAEKVDTLYDAACILAHLSKQSFLADDPNVNQSAEQAVELLRRANQLGYFRSKEKAKQMETDESLDALREREDFKKLLAEVVQSNTGE